MSDILLAKPILPPGFIDVSVGEPHIVRDHLINTFSLSPYELPNINNMYEYPPPNGYKPLVKLLEDKYKAPVVITNGAKQALGATFYALNKMGKQFIGMRKPFWALIPPLVQMHGAVSVPTLKSADSYLLLVPNNPDGFSSTPADLKCLEDKCKEEDKPLIHDAAYYTHIYLPGNRPLIPIGDVQIYSISKMLGLSGLRLGYVVCPNKDFYKLIVQYMEAMTVGVSVVSQIFLYDLLSRMNSYPTLTERFEGLSANSLAESKKIIQKVDPEILEVNSEIESTPGMFGWFKVGPKADFQKAKVNFIDGALFGVPGMVRMNLAFNADKMEEIVSRLNSIK